MIGCSVDTEIKDGDLISHSNCKLKEEGNDGK